MLPVPTKRRLKCRSQRRNETFLTSRHFTRQLRSIKRIQSINSERRKQTIARARARTRQAVLGQHESVPSRAHNAHTRGRRTLKSRARSRRLRSQLVHGEQRSHGQDLGLDERPRGRESSGPREQCDARKVLSHIEVVLHRFELLRERVGFEIARSFVRSMSQNFMVLIHVFCCCCCCCSCLNSFKINFNTHSFLF